MVLCDKAFFSSSARHPRRRVGGAIKVYGVTSKTRDPSLAQLPTLDEQGMTGFEVVIWYGLWVPKGTPKLVLDKLSVALQTAVQDSTFSSRMADLGAVPASPANAAPEPLRAFLKSEIEIWGPIIKKSGIQPE
jgi:tripartite-type tricarboxylate transporter receptor subunit TctC